MSLNSLKTISRKRRFENKVRSSSLSALRAEDCSLIPSKLTQIDFLGEPVTFNYKGSQSYDSVTGCVCSLSVVVLLVTYLAVALVSMRSSSSVIIASLDVN
jgi:hypothetical protein